MERTFTIGNSFFNNNVSNISGCGGGEGYQAGIADLGLNDKISKNNISGAGYKNNGHKCGDGSTIAIFSIDKSHRTFSP